MHKSTHARGSRHPWMDGFQMIKDMLQSNRTYFTHRTTQKPPKSMHNVILQTQSWNAILLRYLLVECISNTEICKNPTKMHSNFIFILNFRIGALWVYIGTMLSACVNPSKEKKGQAWIPLILRLYYFIKSQ